MTKVEAIIIIAGLILVLIGTLGHMMNYVHSLPLNYTLNDCAMMFFGDDWRGGFDNNLANWCNNITEWKEMISKY